MTGCRTSKIRSRYATLPKTYTKTKTKTNTKTMIKQKVFFKLGGQVTGCRPCVIVGRGGHHRWQITPGFHLLYHSICVCICIGTCICICDCICSHPRWNVAPDFHLLYYSICICIRNCVCLTLQKESPHQFTCTVVHIFHRYMFFCICNWICF